MAKKNKIASVLAFEKKLVPSDGFMYGTTWEKRYNESTPLSLQEKSVRGTISNRLKAADANDPAKLDAKVESPNLQRVDSCALNGEQDTLRLHFTLKVLSNVEQPSACNNSEFQESYTASVKTYIEGEGFKELSKRYAVNIANARFLWRNRVGAEKLEVVVKQLNTDEIKEWAFNSVEFGLRDFDTEDEKILSLSEKIADALSGKTPFLMLDINAYAKVGVAQEVYPSEELVLDKSSGTNKKRKILYDIKDIAGMHSQKIGNAIRCIDTWYPGNENSTGPGPIAAEPYGAVTNLGVAYRNPKNKSDFFTLFDKFALGEKLSSKEEEHYVMAVLIRGGVFGESSKE